MTFMEIKEANKSKGKEIHEVMMKPWEPRNTMHILKPKKLLIH
jgi:hypothetical protein